MTVIRKSRLELTWVGKEYQPKVEPRILIKEDGLSYQASLRVSVNDIFDNYLIQGDSLLSLKSLESTYAGKIKCVFVNPPNNTFTDEDDLHHSKWLSMMRDRLKIIRQLLREDGSVWITIDNNEVHYLKMLCDEIFGEVNFVANVIWQNRVPSQNNVKWLSDIHENILVFAKEKEQWRPNLIPKTEEGNEKYKNPDNDPRGAWAPADITVNNYRPNNSYEITAPSGKKHIPDTGRSWKYNKLKLEELIADNRIWFGSKGDGIPRLKRFLSEINQGLVATTVWLNNEVGDSLEARREAKEHNLKDILETPKPERLVQRVLTISTNPGELVLDLFSGSGSTGAVAQKMGRRWIMIESRDDIQAIIISRLKKVIDGDDLGGISKNLNWKGGGGYNFYKLAKSLMVHDNWGNWIINKNYTDDMLAEAVCKLEGFTYAPNNKFYWQHGYSSENAFIYITKAMLSELQLHQLSIEVGQERSLLVLCSAFQGKSEYPNLSVKKISKQIISRCEWGKDDYSIENQPLFL